MMRRMARGRVKMGRGMDRDGWVWRILEGLMVLEWCEKRYKRTWKVFCLCLSIVVSRCYEYFKGIVVLEFSTARHFVQSLLSA